jgi:uridine kinase
LQILLDEIDRLLKINDRTIVAIDGNSTAGKSTLAAFLKNAYTCNVISMDHFFLRPEQRTRERLIQPGGNIDYERFVDQVLNPLKSESTFAYRPYDCKSGEFTEPITIDQRPLIVIEGVYSMHPNFTKPAYNLYEIKVFLQVDEDEQKRRLLDRNPLMYERFINEWIPMENLYFEYFKIANNCDYIF